LDLEYSWLKKRIREISGIDLNSYRPEQMKRLMDKAIEKSGAKNYVQFVKSLENNPERIQDFRDSITINVSYLFRDAARWADLETVLTGYVKQRGEEATGTGGTSESVSLKMWSAGCSIGAEPYTLAMISENIAEKLTLVKFKYHILCTDIDNTMLNRARQGVFTEKEAKEVPTDILEKYFVGTGNPGVKELETSSSPYFYKAIPGLKARMVFRNHNMLSDNWESNYDVIVCRNVMIYFTTEIKERLFHNFGSALRENGILFIGGTEVIFKPAEYGLKNEKAGIYRKIQKL